MLITDVWPLFGLRLTTPRLELRVIRDDDLPGLVDAAVAGIHDADRMPFSVRWTDSPPAQLAQEFAAFHWSRRASLRPQQWEISLAVLLNGRPIGVQDFGASEFAITRTVSSGSWLTRAEQGKGLGTEMRVALLSLAFDHLGAEWAESGAALWNTSSLSVSAKLGYRENGIERHRVGDELAEMQRLVLHRDDFRRPDWVPHVEGVDGIRPMLGIQ